MNSLTVYNNARQLYMQNVYAFENSFLRIWGQASTLSVRRINKVADLNGES